jgi:hypothetical protein
MAYKTAEEKAAHGRRYYAANKERLSAKKADYFQKAKGWASVPNP